MKPYWVTFSKRRSIDGMCLFNTFYICSEWQLQLAFTRLRSDEHIQRQA